MGVTTTDEANWIAELITMLKAALPGLAGTGREAGPVPVGLVPGPGGEIGVLSSVNQVMIDMKSVGKGSKHAQGFKYRSTDDVMNALHPVLAKHDLFVMPHVLEARREQIEIVYKNGGAKTEHMYTLRIRYTLWHVDGSHVSGDVISQGPGVTPLSPGAAMSYGLKYWVSQTFMIPFQDDRMDMEQAVPGGLDDRDVESRKAKPKPETESETESDVAMADKGQVSDLLNLVKALTDADKTKFKAEGGTNWSFQPRHQWTAKQYAEALAWVMTARGEEPFEPVTGDDGVPVARAKGDRGGAFEGDGELEARR